MKKFLIRILVFSLLFFVFDKVFILVRNQVSGNEVDKRLEMVLNGEINADVYILGSSRGARNVIAKQVEDAIGKSTYNLSYPGSNIDFHEYLLKEILVANKKPEKVLLVVDDYLQLISEGSTIGFRYDRLYPLVAYSRVRKELVARGEKNAILSNLFILHQLNRSNFSFRPKQFSKNDSIFENGSMHLSLTSPKFDRTFKDFPETIEYPIEKETELLKSKFLSLVDICKKENIELTLCFSPNFRLNIPDFESRLKTLAGDGVNFMCFDEANPVYRDPDYFVDSAHLNFKGAKIFTDDVIAFLRQQ